MLDRQPAGLRECSYDEAHNRIYGSIAFAEEAGIEPHKDFRLTQYMLEEDTDDIPLIDYVYGRDGKHFLVCNDHAETNRYLPILRQHLGNDFGYIIHNDESDNTFDQDDQYDYDDDPEIADNQTINIYDCIKECDADDLSWLASCLGIQLDPNSNIQQLRLQYISEALKDPADLLMRLPIRDIAALESIADLPDEKAHNVMYPNTGYIPVIYQLGLVDFVKETDTIVHYRVAEDFWKAIRPHIKKGDEHEANQARVNVEAIVCGLANLYGFVSLLDTKRYLSELLDMPYEAATELFEIVLSHSAQLAFMTDKGNPDTKPSKKNYETIYGFTSPYGWDSTHALADTIARRDKIAPQRREYTMEEVIKASASIPSIPNKRQDEFARYLQTSLGYDRIHTDLICHNLWLRAQHEEDPDNIFGKYIDYFAHQVIDRAPKSPIRSTVEIGIRHMQAYMNAMPRWFLKGHTPEEV